MTAAAQPSFRDPAFALALSGAIHALLAVALFASLDSGTPDASTHRGRHGEMINVRLLPLPPGGSARASQSGEDYPPSERTALLKVSGARAEDQPGPVLPNDGAPPAGIGASGTGTGTAQGTRGGAPALSGAEVEAFRDRLLQHIEQFRRYPPEARDASIEGLVRVQFVMDRSGKVVDAWVERSSGSAILDNEAVAAVRRAQPLPTPPAGWPESFGVTLPIGFSLQ